MRQLHTIITLVLLLAGTCLLGSDGYKITINIKGQADTECYLAYHFGNRQYLKDTTEVNSQGIAIFQGNERLTPGMYLVVLDDDRNFEIIIDDDQFFTVFVDPNDLITSATFEDSDDNTAFYEYIRFLGRMHEQRRALQEELNDSLTTPEREAIIMEELTALDKKVVEKQNQIIDNKPEALLASIILAQREPEMPEPILRPDGSPDREKMYQVFKERYFDNIDFSDDRILQTPVYHSVLRRYFNNVIIQHPDSVIREADRIVDKARANKEMFKYTVWFITNNAESSPMMGMDAVFVHMVENYYMTDEVDWLDEDRKQRIINRAMELKPLLLGKVAPNIKVYDTEGKAIELHDVEAEYIIVYFWDSECGFCRRATPKIKKAYENLSDYNIIVFSVNTETDKDKWLNVIADYEHNWIHVNDVRNRSGFRDKYNIYAIPKIFILDSDKKILAKDIGAEHVEQFIRQNYQLRSHR